MTKFTIGCDPEIFLKKNSQPIAAVGAVPGTKDKPFPVENGAVQVDGLALEFNTAPVPLDQRGATVFNRNIVSVMRQMKAISSENIGRVSFSQESTQEFSEEYLASLPDEAKILGCDPDWNAYTLKHNPAPDASVPFRSAGGHIHFGWGADQPVEDEEYIKMCADFIKVLDFAVGIPLKFLDRNERRRQLYGKAGAFRPKSYGVEYRSPSNWWIFEKDRRAAIYHQVEYAGRNFTAVGGDVDKFFQRFVGASPEVIRDIIDNGTPRQARRFISPISTALLSLVSAQDAADAASKEAA